MKLLSTNKYGDRIYMGKNEKRTNDSCSYISNIIKAEEKFNKKLEKINENKISTYELENKDFLINKGIEFAYNDINLEGVEKAPLEYRNLILFLRGYQIGIRRIRAEAMTHYNNGLSLEEAKLKEHLAFIEGYNVCIEKEKGHKHR